MTDSITVSEATSIRTRLEELEGVISEGLQTFVEVGNAIREIRDNRLYRESHDTFEEYCKERWGWSKRHTNYQVEAANTAQIVGEISPTRPNASQAHELAPLAKEDPEEAQAVWAELKEQHGDKITAKKVKQAVNGRLKREKEYGKLGEEVAAVVREIDPSDSDLPASTRQLNYLGGIDDPAERLEVATRVADGSAKTVWEASSQLKQEKEVESVEDSDIRRIVRAGAMEYVVEYGDGNRHTVIRNVLLERGFKKCDCCNGFGVVNKETD